MKRPLKKKLHNDTFRRAIMLSYKMRPWDAGAHFDFERR